MLTLRDIEIRKNYEFFKGVVNSMMDEHAGETALIHNCQIVGLFPSASEAIKEGARQFGEKPFSAQRVINRPIDLGFLSHASDNGFAV